MITSHIVAVVRDHSAVASLVAEHNASLLKLARTNPAVQFLQASGMIHRDALQGNFVDLTSEGPWREWIERLRVDADASPPTDGDRQCQTPSRYRTAATPVSTFRPHVKISARSQTAVEKEHWEQWLAAHLDSPLLDYLDWPGKGEPAQSAPSQTLPTAAGDGGMATVSPSRSYIKVE